MSNKKDAITKLGEFKIQEKQRLFELKDLERRINTNQLEVTIFQIRKISSKINMMLKGSTQFEIETKNDKNSIIMLNDARDKLTGIRDNLYKLANDIESERIENIDSIKKTIKIQIEKLNGGFEFAIINKEVK